MIYKYRIVLRRWGFEPQMRCNSGLSGMFWTPLLRTGYWAEPDSFTLGRVNGKYLMGFRAAMMAIRRAKLINSGGLIRCA